MLEQAGQKFVGAVGRPRMLELVEVGVVGLNQMLELVGLGGQLGMLDLVGLGGQLGMLELVGIGGQLGMLGLVEIGLVGQLVMLGLVEVGVSMGQVGVEIDLDQLLLPEVGILRKRPGWKSQTIAQQRVVGFWLVPVFQQVVAESFDHGFVKDFLASFVGRLVLGELCLGLPEVGLARTGRCQKSLRRRRLCRCR